MLYGDDNEDEESLLEENHENDNNGNDIEYPEPEIQRNEENNAIQQQNFDNVDHPEVIVYPANNQVEHHQVPIHPGNFFYYLYLQNLFFKFKFLVNSNL